MTSRHGIFCVFFIIWNLQLHKISPDRGKAKSVAQQIGKSIHSWRTVWISYGDCLQVSVVYAKLNSDILSRCKYNSTDLFSNCQFDHLICRHFCYLISWKLLSPSVNYYTDRCESVKYPLKGDRSYICRRKSAQEARLKCFEFHSESQETSFSEW